MKTLCTLTLILVFCFSVSVASHGDDDTGESLMIQLRMGGALPYVKFRWMSLENDFAALKRIVYREKAPLLERAALISSQMPEQFPYGNSAFGIHSTLASQRGWLVKLLTPFFQNIRTEHFDKVVNPALNASAEWQAQTTAPTINTPWHSNSRLELAAASLRGLLQLSLRTDEGEALRSLNVVIGRILSRLQGGATPSPTDRDLLRSALTASQTQLDALMLSPRARPLAAVFQAILGEEIRA